jgi:hypothetical protein
MENSVIDLDLPRIKCLFKIPTTLPWHAAISTMLQLVVARTLTSTSTLSFYFRILDLNVTKRSKKLQL